MRHIGSDHHHLPGGAKPAIALLIVAVALGCAVLAGAAAVLTPLHDLAWWLALCVSLAILALVAAFRFYKRAQQAAPALAQPAVALVALLVGCVILALPLMPGIDAPDGGTSAPWTDVLAALYAAPQSMVLQLAYGDWMKEVPAFAPFNLLYAIDIFLYIIALPAAALFVAVDAVVNGLTGSRLALQSWRAAWGRTPADIYVLHGIDARSLVLAHSLFQRVRSAQGSGRGGASAGPYPLVIVADITEDSDGAAITALKSDALGAASLIFARLPIENVPARLSRRARERCRIRYFLLGDNPDENVRASIALTDSLVCLMEIAELERRGWALGDGTAPGADGRTGAAPAPRLHPDTLACARRQHIYCFHANPDDDLIFDALPHRGPTEELRRAYAEHATANVASDPAALTPLEREIRSLLEVRLIDEVQESVYDTFAACPLYRALDPAVFGPAVGGAASPATTARGRGAGPLPSPGTTPLNLADLIRTDPTTGTARADGAALARAHQLLVVLVAGLGSYGLCALRAAFWFGRLPGVELRIIGLDANGHSVAEQLAATCPGVMRERSAAGAPTVGLDPAAGPAVRQEGYLPGDLPTVTILDIDATSSALDDLLEGRTVDGWCGVPAQDAASTSCRLERTRTRIADTARIYAVVALGDDERDLGVARHIQRTLAERTARGRFGGAYPTSPGDAENPVVVPLIAHRQMMESAAHLAHGDGGTFAVHPFGAAEQTFTYDQVVHGTWEAQAINLHAAYCLMYAARTQAAPASGRGAAAGHEAARRPNDEEILRGYNDKEAKKLSNRAVARFAPYRLWMMGIAPKDVQPGTPRFDAAWRAWLAGLGINPDTPVNELFSQLAHEPDAARPVLAAMGYLEHARWNAFYRAEGWRPIADDRALAGYRALVRDGGARKSEDLKCHYYLVDDLRELARRGAVLGEDPFDSDNAMVAATPACMARLLYPASKEENGEGDQKM